MISPARILIADDDDAMRDALSAVINSDPRLHLVGSACDAQEAIQLASQLRPDVAVLDVKMPFGGGSRATLEIRSQSPHTKILAFSAYGDRATVLDLVRRGASGFLVKGSAPSELLSGIHAVHSGASTLSPVVAHEVVGQLHDLMHQEDLAQDLVQSTLASLQSAMRGGLHSVYQPIFTLADRQVIGFEALSRFHSGGSPVHWFDKAEKAGILIDFELAAIASALASRPSPLNSYLALNASPQTILSGRLTPLLASSSNLVIEITEHAPVSNYPALALALAPLRARGVRLAVDDAGSGFASLRHILLLAPQIIKLDLTLVRGIDLSAPQRALAQALTTFAHALNATVVAEGIESQTELQVLLSLGVECGQGYLLGRPRLQPDSKIEVTS